MRSNKIMIGLFSIIMLSCEMVADVNVPFESPRITVNGVFSADSIWRVSLVKSKFVLDEGQYQMIDNATVIIKEDGVEVERLQHDVGGLYISLEGKKPNFGKSHEIEVSAPGMETVNAVSTLPVQAQLIDAVLSRREGSGNDGRNYNFVIDVTFNDNAASTDYYELSVIEQVRFPHYQTGDTITAQRPVFVFTDDTMFGDEELRGVYFDDTLINGEQVKVSLKGYDFIQPESKFLITLKTLSKDLYEYKITADRQEFTSGDPFAQPVHVYNNITNGFGIFAGYAESMIEIKQ